MTPLRLSLLLAVAASMAACDGDLLEVDDPAPDPPRNLAGWYYARAVYLTWELGPRWNGESFRVYARRRNDSRYARIAEVSNCTRGACSYTDVNISPGVTYEYYVAAVGRGGRESSSDHAVQVAVPHPTPPDPPASLEVVALDGANYLRWSANARNAADFSFYRVYLVESGKDYLLGETDSEGFLDTRVENGKTYRYSVTAVDDQGHESLGSPHAQGTPRPDYHGEWIYSFQDEPAHSAFRFPRDETTYPILPGHAPNRHFRLEVDGRGWWLVPGPGVELYNGFFETTALKCGVAADRDCRSLDRAPLTGYTFQALALFPQVTYILRVPGEGGAVHYGAIRVVLLGFDQQGKALMIFDWAFQLQPGNPNLAPGIGG